MLVIQFQNEVYGKNAYHRKFIQNLKCVLKILMKIFGLIVYFEAFWSLKNWFIFLKKNCLSYNFNVRKL